MASRRHAVLVTALAAALMLSVQMTMAQTTYTLKVSTDSASYVAGQPIKVTGSVAPAPGPSTGVTLKIVNPSGSVVAVGETSVGAASGLYNYTFVAGGSGGWTTGKYSVNATWGAYPPQIFASALFTYSPASTTTSTTKTTTTSSTSTTTSFTTSSSSSASASTTNTSTTPTTSSSSSGGGGGGIPEFPFQAVTTAIFAALLVSAYLLVRRFKVRVPSIPSQ